MRNIQRQFLQEFLLCLVLVFAVGLLYGNFLRNPLIFDDEPWFENAAVIYASPLTSFGLRWFPYVSLGWAWSLTGPDLFWLRLGNLLLHAANTVTLFIFLRQLFHSVPGVSPTNGNSALPTIWLAFFGALIFSLHPVAVYGVAYLVQRSILMATLFSLLALLMYLKGLQSTRQTWFVASAVSYFLAVFSKEHSVMVPAVALSLTFLLHQPTIALFRRILPVYILFALVAASVIAMSSGVIGAAYEPAAQTMIGSQLEPDNDSPGSNAGDVANIYLLSVVTQSYLFFKYLLLWLIPFPGWMSVDMREPFAAHLLSWPHTVGLAGLILYGTTGIKLLFARGRKGLLGFAMLFPLILFATELTTVRIQEPFVLYRSYLWMPGLLVALPILFGHFRAQYGFSVLLIIAIMLVPVSLNRLTTFASALALWNDAEKLVQNKSNLSYLDRIYYNRGSAYGKLGLAQQAIDDYSRAIEIKPGMNSKYYFNRGNAYIKLGLVHQAIADYSTAIKINPGISSRYYNRSLAYLGLGHPVEALSDINAAIRINPDYAEAIGIRGIIHETLKKHDAAIIDFRRSCELGQPPACTKWHELETHVQNGGSRAPGANE